MKIWDLARPSDSVFYHKIDAGGGAISPYFDVDLGVLFLGGKGDATVRIMEYNGGIFHAF